MARVDVRELESRLGHLQMLIEIVNDRGDNDGDLPYAFKRTEEVYLAAAKKDLAKIEMYDKVLDAIHKARMLVDAGRLREGADTILHVTRELMEKSGANKELRKLYTRPKGSSVQ
jgi:hypothetical protein